jgi:hypothetical protein
MVQLCSGYVPVTVVPSGCAGAAGVCVAELPLFSSTVVVVLLARLL